MNGVNEMDAIGAGQHRRAALHRVQRQNLTCGTDRIGRFAAILIPISSRETANAGSRKLGGFCKKTTSAL
jgi:hypothetical protein